MQHLLWQEEANEFIKRFPQRRGPPTMLQQSRSAGMLYTNPKAANSLTLNKRASTGGGRAELLTTQQRHQRDLFSGELGIPNVRTHVGSVVHTFETLALQRRLQQQKQQQQPTFSKYLISGTKFNQLKRRTHEAQQQPRAFNQREYAPKHQQTMSINRTTTNTINDITKPRYTLNERNKQIAEHYLFMEADYRKNLFNTMTKLSNNNNQNKLQNNIDENTVIVNTMFDDMLASYSGAEDDVDVVDDAAHVNIINIGGNETEDSVLRISLSNASKPKSKRLKKAPAPPLKRATTAMPTANTSTIPDNSSVMGNAAEFEAHDFLRGSTLSQSFVCQSKWQKAKKAPAPPAPDTSTKNNNTTTQLRLALANPFRNGLLFTTKRAKSFNLLEN